METVLKRLLPFYNDLPNAEKELLLAGSILRTFQKGHRLSYGNGECSGLNMILSGRARVFLYAASGAEITLYRLLPNECCVLSASCMIRSLDFEVHVEYEEDTKLIVIPQQIYRTLCNSHLKAKDFTLELVSNRFTDVIRLLGEVTFSDMGKRLSELLIEYSELMQTKKLQLTHEQLACDLGTAREVVSRLLKQMEKHGEVRLSRGLIELIDN